MLIVALLADERPPPEPPSPDLTTETFLIKVKENIEKERAERGQCPHKAFLEPERMCV